MNPEKRILLASGISLLVLVLYMQVIGKRLPNGQTEANLSAQSHQADSVDQIAGKLPDEATVTIESPSVALKLGTSSASVRTVALKNFHDMDRSEPLTFDSDRPILASVCDTGDSKWSLVSHDAVSARWECQTKDGVSKQLEIVLDQQKPVFTVNLRAKNGSKDLVKEPFELIASWHRADKLVGNANVLEAVFRVNTTGGCQRSQVRYREGIVRTVPRGTIAATLSERYFCQSIKLNDKSVVRMLRSPKGTISISTQLDGMIQSGEEVSQTIPVYVGPRDFFQMRDAGFENAFSVKFLGKVGLALMVFLSWMASVTHNYGVAIILLGATITLLLSPFTLISLRSMKKMQALQPKIDHIKKKHEKDPNKMNQEIFALFKEHKVSPLSGCLPMLLQLPIFFALLTAISHFIGLRGQRFLWIKDLSLPDRLAHLPIGIDLNLLPILMAVAMFFQTKLSQSNVQSSGTNMNTGPIMSILFGFMFYSVPSGLVLYWLTNSIVSITLTKLAKT